MKASMVIALVSAAAVPAAIQSGATPLSPFEMGEDSDLMEKAAAIARRDFGAAAELTVLEVKVTDQRIGGFGERIRPDPGYMFHVAKVKIENSGKIDIAVSSWHFSAIDEAGSDHSIEMGGAHEDFDASRLAKGHARMGTLTFELIKGSFVTGITWDGDLANATGPAPEYPYR